MYTATKDDNVSNLKNTAQNLRSAAGEMADDARHDLREAAGKAGRKVRAFIHSAEDELVHARDSVTTQIRSKPLQSGLIALAAGVVFGALLRRR